MKHSPDCQHQGHCLLSGASSLAEQNYGDGVQHENGAKEEKEEKDLSQISFEAAEDQEPVAAAAAIAESKIGNVQSPASVWLPYKDTNVNRNKARLFII